MKIQPFTLGLVVVAGLLGGFVYFSEVHKSSQPEAVQAQKLFGFEEKQVKFLKLQTQLRSLSFERDSGGKWQMVSPDQTSANDASIAYLLNLLATAMNDRPIKATGSDRKAFGLDQPMATIDVILDNQQSHKLILGGYDFNHSQIYAQADPPANSPANSPAELKIAVVSPEFDNAVNRPLAQWKAASPQTTSPTSSPSSSPSSSSSPSPTSSAPSPAAPTSPPPSSKPSAP